MDGSFPDAEPFGHAVHGDPAPAGAGCGEGRVYLGGGLGAGLFRALVVVPGLADELVEVGVVWGLLAGGHGAAGVGLVPETRVSAERERRRYCVGGVLGLYLPPDVVNTP